MSTEIFIQSRERLAAQAEALRYAEDREIHDPEQIGRVANIILFRHMLQEMQPIRDMKALVFTNAAAASPGFIAITHDGRLTFQAPILNETEQELLARMDAQIAEIQRRYFPEQDEVPSGA